MILLMMILVMVVVAALSISFFFFQAEDGIRDYKVTGVQTCALPIYIYGAIIAGADIRSVRMTPGVDFIAELERAIRELIPKPKMLVIGFPSNPTAHCVDLGFFERVIALAREHDILVVHDLAYADIVFDSYKAPSIMQVPGARDIAVEFFTMSKSYNMAGWRIGFMVGNRDLVHALARIKSYHDYGSFTPVQVASI